MAHTLKLESTLTDRYQTTVPNAVRHALKLGKRDKISYLIQPDGGVMLARVSSETVDDPVLGKFLNFLAHDMATHPEHLKSIDTGLRKRIKSLVKNAKVDLDAPLAAEDE
ncbi:MAG: regulator [Gallionellales bacterium RIFCSPHIGHO2_02_FULL_57_16]|nr:MAG: regulator [Gallionellales bacterium RIFCSPHIGHO2_02_FULL_57_16]